jgi:hypothetical protein
MSLKEKDEVFSSLREGSLGAHVLGRLHVACEGYASDAWSNLQGVRALCLLEYAQKVVQLQPLVRMVHC